LSVKVEKLILVTAKHMPQHKYFVSVAEDLAKELGVELETRYEDYAFLADYGEKDEYDMPWTPQLLAKLSDGRIVPILTRLPFSTDTLQFQLGKAKEQALERLRSYGVEV